MVTPVTWKQDAAFIRFKAPGRDSSNGSDLADSVVLEKSCVDDSILLMKFFALNSGIAHQLLTASDGSEIELPFEVNEEEARIIHHPSSSFILGRSGTGKTTVITTKLLHRQQRAWLAENGFQDRTSSGEREQSTVKTTNTGILKQAVITRSPKLSVAIKHHISKMQRYQ